MNHSTQFGDIIKNLRERNKLTAEQLSKNTGVSVPTIHKAENGNTQIRMSNLHKGYRDLCRNQQEWLSVCVQWLASHPEVGVSAHTLEKYFNGVVSEGAEYNQKTMEDMAYICSGKSAADLSLIKRVAANIKNRPFVTMIKGYLDAVETTLAN